eukprot:534610-Pleurochrysis_carterae.AAC.2
MAPSSKPYPPYRRASGGPSTTMPLFRPHVHRRPSHRRRRREQSPACPPRLAKSYKRRRPSHGHPLEAYARRLLGPLARRPSLRVSRRRRHPQGEASPCHISHARRPRGLH